MDPQEGYSVHSVGLEVGSLNPRGTRLRKISRADISNWTHFQLDFPIVCNWEVDDFEQNAIVVGYAIFEYDTWPAGTKSVTVTMPDNSLRYVTFRSNDGAYVKGRWMGNTNADIYLPFAVGWHFDGTEMEVDITDF